jgi:peroxiredoxin
MMADMLHAAVLLAGLAIGDAAPDFALLAEDDKPVRLSALPRRPIVLAFFPKAFTPG